MDIIQLPLPGVLKYCPTCKRTLPMDAFGKSARRKWGKNWQCKECKNKYCQPYRETHREYIRAYSKRHYQANKERKRALHEVWKAANPGKMSVYVKRWQERHPEWHTKWKEQYRTQASHNSRRWQERNPDKVKANKERQHKRRPHYGTEHYRANKERLRQLAREWRARNPEKVRAKGQRRHAAKAGTYIGPIDFGAIWERGNGICHICLKPVTMQECHFDHVVPLSRGGTHTADNIRPSHAFCNLSKGAKLMSELQTP